MDGRVRRAGLLGLGLLVAGVALVVVGGVLGPAPRLPGLDRYRPVGRRGRRAAG